MASKPRDRPQVCLEVNMQSKELVGSVHPVVGPIVGTEIYLMFWAGLGISIIGSPKGIIDDKTARKEKLMENYFVAFGRKLL